jgi:PAS domain S-box-containing protein
LSRLKQVRNLRLRSKLLLIYISLFVTLFGCGGAGALYLIKKTVNEYIENDLRNSTRAIINLVETTAQGSITNYLRAVAERNLEIAHRIHRQHLEGRLTQSQARQQIRTILLGQTIGSTGYIYCINSQGVATVHPNAKVEGNNWIHFDFVRRQTLLKTGYIEYQWQNPGETVARPKALYMTYFAPYDWIISVSTYRDEFKELLPMEEIRSSVKDLKFGISGYVFVTDRQGNLIIHPELEGENFYQLPVADTGFFEEMVAEEFGQVTYWWQNPGEPHIREKLALYGYIPELEWIVGSTGYLDEIYAPIQRTRTVAILFIGMAVILSTVLTLLVSNSITRRLRHLMAVINRGDQGDLTVRVVPGADDEIGRLGKIFNTFLERLQTYHGKLAAEVERHRSTASSLQQMRDFNALVLATVQTLVVVLDPDGRLVSFNQACQTCSGYRADEINGERLDHRLVPEDEAASVCAAIAALTPQQTSNHHTHHWITKTGGRRLIQWSNAVIPGSAGDVEFIVCAGVDITDQRAAEKALQESKAKFEAVFNQTYQFIGMLAPDGTVRSANQTALDFAGVTEAELIGLPFWETHFWQHSKETQRDVERAVQAASRGEFKRMEVTHMRADGELRYVDFSVKPIRNEAGQVFMLIPEGRDITEQKQMESQLLQAQKMDAIGTLAGGIAHDFNNNLQAISGFTQLLLMDGYGTDRQKEMLATIQHACNHSSELTQQLLTFGRKIESRLVPLDMNVELEEVINLLRHTLPRMIRIVTRLDEELRIVDADRIQFEQVVMNLGINAGHAMPTGGTLTITTRNVDLDDDFCRQHLGAAPGAYAMLAISDTGHGMDEKTREHIFEPFFTTRDTGKGTGLGLAMVYGIVKNHKGYITCTSQPGQGTTFNLYLPAVTGIQAAQPHVHEAVDVKGGHETILLVDDDQAVRELGREILERFGYRVWEAHDGESAIAQFSRMASEIDLIVLDLNMPGMGGNRCLETIRNTNRSIPILIASGYSPDADAKASLERLAQGFVAKPYEINKLLSTVRDTLDRPA